METSLPITLRSSRKKYLVRLGAGALFTAVGLGMASEEPFIGYLTAGFFGIGLLVCAVQLLPNSSYLRLGPEGFTVCSLFRSHTVPWSDVAEFWVIRVGGNDMVGWDFAPHYQAQAVGRAVATSLTGVGAALPDSYGMDPEELASLMNELREQYGC